MYAAFLIRMGQLYEPGKIKDGKFGAMMNVSLTNEGPVTFTLDSRKFEYVQPSGRPPIHQGHESGATPATEATDTRGKE